MYRYIVDSVVKKREIMSHRAMLCVQEGGKLEVYHHRWCALTLDFHLLWGPEAFQELVGESERWTDSGDWLKEDACEGAALLDLDKRTLIWFGGEDTLDDIALREVHSLLLRSLWPGWAVRWATGGIIEVGSNAGVPAATFISETDNSYRIPFEYYAEVELNSVLVALTDANGVAMLRTEGDFETLLIGPAAVDELLSAPRLLKPSWSGAELPRLLISLDLSGKSIVVASSAPCELAATRLAERWPGWVTTWHGDDYRAHPISTQSIVELSSEDVGSLIGRLSERIQQVAGTHRRADQRVRRDAEDRLNSALGDLKADFERRGITRIEF